VAQVSLLGLVQNLLEVREPELAILGRLDTHVVIDQDPVVVEEIVEHVLEPFFGIEMVRVTEDEVPFGFGTKHKVVLVRNDDGGPVILEL
jgi:hypothetical protein